MRRNRINIKSCSLWSAILSTQDFLEAYHTTQRSHRALVATRIVNTFGLTVTHGRVRQVTLTGMQSNDLAKLVVQVFIGVYSER